MRLRTRRATDTELRAAIDSILSYQEGESVTFLTILIRRKGLKFPTNHTAGMKEFERLGYSLRKERNEYGALLRTYVIRGTKNDL